MARSRVDYQDVDEDYLKHRSLKKGAAGWILLAGLGVSYVISGDFAGWNFGLDEGGWGGLMIATILMGLMYTCMVFGLAEMSSALPGRRRRLRLRPARDGAARRLRDRHGRADRVRRGTCGHRGRSSAGTSRRSACSASPAAGWSS